jgi:hypothetical protein
MRLGTRVRRGIADGVGRNPLGLEAQKQTEIPVGKLQDQSAVVKRAVVSGGGPTLLWFMWMS